MVILVLCALYAMGKKYLNEGDIFKKVSLPAGALTFFLFLLIALLLNYGRLFYMWDEFTHWCAVVKHMYLFDALSTSLQSTILNKAYLPGTAIFNIFGFAFSPLS